MELQVHVSNVILITNMYVETSFRSSQFSYWPSIRIYILATALIEFFARVAETAECSAFLSNFNYNRYA